MDEFGHFTGSYSLIKLRDVPRYEFLEGTWLGKILTKAIYDFKNDGVNPLTYRAVDGTCYRPKDRMESDMGSVPNTVQIIIPKDRFLQTWLCHDSGYEDGGLYVKYVGTETYVFVKMSRNKIDLLMKEGIGAEGGNAFERNAVYEAVNWAGWAVWSHGYDTKKRAA